MRCIQYPARQVTEVKPLFRTARSLQFSASQVLQPSVSVAEPVYSQGVFHQESSRGGSLPMPIRQATMVNAMTFLLVDDDLPFRSRLAKALESRGFTVHQAGNVEEGIAAFERFRPSRVVVDLKMPGRGGLDLVDELAKLDPDVAIVVLTGYGSIATAVDAVHRGALDYLQKPADADEVVAVFERDGEHDSAHPAVAAPVPSLARVEWEHIQRILHDCNGNISQAARRLGIHRRSLQRKLGKMPPLE